jgi:hypothetical protein
MSKIFENLQKARELYPDDIAKIDAEEKRITTLLAQKEFYSLETTKALIILCRNDILMARKKLATDRSLIGDEEAQRDLWAIIDARQWFLERVVQNYDAELDAIDKQLQADLMV